MRQHTPAYVIIRQLVAKSCLDLHLLESLFEEGVGGCGQHTSAYVSFRLGQSVDAADVAPWQAANIEGLSRQMLKLL